MGITVDKVGRVLVGYADGCIDDPQNAANRCVSNPPADVTATVRTKLASIARQTSGVGLFKQYDGVISTAPYAPVLSGIADNTVNHLAWTVPADGGAPISGYKLYRGTSSGGETLFASVSASTTTYNDSSLTNGTTYYYRVAAVNQIGQGQSSNELALTPQVKAAPSAPRKLKARGSGNGVSLTWWQPASSGTAAITNYRVYRGIAPGMESFYADAGNKTQFTDSNAQSSVTYYYVVTAVNSVGESARSNEDSAQRK
jgi:predicted phage tail protein